MTDDNHHPAAHSTWWRRAVLWHSLRGIGNSTPAKLTIIIPLVGYLILFNDKIQDWLRLSSEIVGAAPVNGLEPRLLLIYFGLCFIALASFLFSCGCPPEIKKYASPEEYIAEEEQYLSDFGMGLIEHRLKNGDRIAKSRLDDLTQWHNLRPTPQGLEEVRRRGTQMFRGKMQLYYEVLDRSRNSIRWATVSCCYVVGFVALLIPGIRVFIRVSIILYRLVIA